MPNKISRASSRSAQDCTANNFKIKTSISSVALNKAIETFKSNLRRKLYKETKRFVKNHPQEIEALLRYETPTDPLLLETQPELISTAGQSGGNSSRSFKSPWKGHQRWTSSGTFVLTTMSASVGPVTYSFIPWETIRTQLGLLFLIPVIVGWIFVTLPLLNLEQSLGLITRSGPLKVFAVLHRRAVGVGVSTLLMVFFYVPAELILGFHSFAFLLGSATSRLPWAITNEVIEDCISLTTSEACRASKQCLPGATVQECLPSTLKIVLQYYTQQTLGADDVYNAPSFYVLGFVFVLFTLMVSGVLIYFGPSLLGPFASFTTVTTFFLLGLLIVSSPAKYTTPPLGTFSDFTDGAKWRLLLSSPSYWVLGLTAALGASHAIRGYHYILSSFNSLDTNVIQSGIGVILMQLYVAVISSLILARTIYSRTTQLSVLATSDVGIGSTQFGLAFILFPVAFLNLPGGATLFAMLFFLTLWLQSLIRIALMGLMIVIALSESRLFYTIHPAWSWFWTLLMFLWSCIPYLLNFGPDHLSLIRFYQLWRLLTCFAVPCSGFIHLVTIETAHGWSYFVKYLGLKGAILRIIPLAVVSITFVTAYPLFYHEFTYKSLLIPAAMILLSALLCLLAIFDTEPKQKLAYRQRLYWWTVGSYNTLAALINNIVAGGSRYPWRLSSLWPVLLTIPIPILCLLVAAFEDLSLSSLPAYTVDFTYNIVLVATIIGLPPLVGLIKPTLFQTLFPVRQRRWSIYDVPKKRLGPRYVITRHPLRFFEEFFPTEYILGNSKSLYFKKTR